MINYDKNLCVKCGNCATESENGGVKIIDGRIVIDENCVEDWALIAETCPVGALTLQTKTKDAAQGRAARTPARASNELEANFISAG